jgi:hypothetical protein
VKLKLHADQKIHFWIFSHFSSVLLMSELVAETPPASTEPAGAPVQESAEGEAPKATPKRRSSSAAALQGATAEEVKKLSASFGIVGKCLDGVIWRFAHLFCPLLHYFVSSLPSGVKNA